jgi:hypothetical protein
VVGDSLGASNWTENPSLGTRRNPPPDLFKLTRQEWIPGDGGEIVLP